MDGRDAVVASFSYGLNDGGGGDGAAEAVADLIKRSEAVGSDFGGSSGIQGAFKVDKPGDDYFSSSLFYHYQLAHARNELQGTDVFLSGDSVGHLGGWVEGAAMSAINAVVGVCSRMEKRVEPLVRWRTGSPRCSRTTSGSSTAGRTSADDRRAGRA